jgi:hypothetical protein
LTHVPLAFDSLLPQLPNEHCALPLSPPYVNWSVVLMVGAWVVAGVIYPLSFDTKHQDASRSGFRG